MGNQNAVTENAELISTYYAGKKTFSKLRTFRITAIILLLLTAGLIIVWYSLAGNKKNISVLLPAKHYTGISFYNFKDIKNNSLPLVLGQGYSIAAINLQERIDFTDAAVSFMAKGKSGEEKIAVIFKDYHNFSNANLDDRILTSLLSKDKWQIFKIKLKHISLPLDKNKIIQIRFDASTNLTDNNADAEVYIKNIAIE